MGIKLIFIDTGFIFSYTNSKDENHVQTKSKMNNIFEGNYGSIFFSNFIFMHDLHRI